MCNVRPPTLRCVAGEGYDTCSVGKALRIALTKGRSMSAGNVRWYHGRGLGIGVGGAVGKTFAIVGGFFGSARVFFSVVGMLKSKGLYTVVSLAVNSLGTTGAALGVVYAASS